MAGQAVTENQVRTLVALRDALVAEADAYEARAAGLLDDYYARRAQIARVNAQRITDRLDGSILF